MGYSGGTDIARAVIDAVKANVADVGARSAIYTALINVLEDADWDTQDEALGRDPAFDRAYRSLHPDLDLDERFE